MNKMHTAIAVAIVAIASACQTDDELAPDLDEAYFRCRVEPVLDERCSMLECHGDDVRPFRIYTRNRLRLDADPVQLNLPITDDELAVNYDNALAFTAGAPEDAFLVRKPLDEAAGGYFHQGRELYGDGDVFASTEDPGYQILLAWIEGETEDPACTYVGQTDGAGDGQ